MRGELVCPELLLGEVRVEHALHVVVDHHLVDADPLAAGGKRDGAEHLHGGECRQRGERAHTGRELRQVGGGDAELGRHGGDLGSREGSLGYGPKHKPRVSGNDNAEVEIVVDGNVANGAVDVESLLFPQGERVCGKPHGDVCRGQGVSLIDVRGHNGDARHERCQVVDSLEVHRASPPIVVVTAG